MAAKKKPSPAKHPSRNTVSQVNPPHSTPAAIKHAPRGQAPQATISKKAFGTPGPKKPSPGNGGAPAFPHGTSGPKKPSPGNGGVPAFSIPAPKKAFSIPVPKKAFSIPAPKKALSKSTSKTALSKGTGQPLTFRVSPPKPPRVSPPKPVAQPSPEVEAAIRNAATAVGVDYGYMIAMARQESSFDPNAQAKTSSALGLYQFLNDTWLGQIKASGVKYGLSGLADSIVKREKNYVVLDPSTKQHILDLRRDPVISALMGAEFSKANEVYLERKLGREVTPGELYMAHFLGRGGAEQFLRARDQGKGEANAAELFPGPAKANKSIFFSRDGGARTVDEVYATLNEKIARGKDSDKKNPGGGGKPPVSYEPPKTPTKSDWFDSRVSGSPPPGRSFGFGPNGTPGNGLPNWFEQSFGGQPRPGSSFGFGLHGTPGGFTGPFSNPGLGIGTIGRGSSLTSFGLNGFVGSSSGMGSNGIGTIGLPTIGSPRIGIGSIGSPPLSSFGLHGGIGSGSTYGRLGGWEFGVYGSAGRGPIVRSSSTSYGSTGLGSIGSGSSLTSFGVGGFNVGSSGGSSGVGTSGGSSLGGSSFSISGFSTGGGSK